MCRQKSVVVKINFQAVLTDICLTNQRKSPEDISNLPVCDLDAGGQVTADLPQLTPLPPVHSVGIALRLWEDDKI